MITRISRVIYLRPAKFWLERLVDSESDDSAFSRTATSISSGSDKREDSEEELEDQHTEEPTTFIPVEITDIPDQYEVRWCVSSNP